MPPSPADSPADRSPRRRRISRRLGLVLLAVALVGGVAVVEVPQFLSSARSTTVWQAITSGITNGTVPKQTALEAFAYVYKVNMPDVTIPNSAIRCPSPTATAC